MTRFRMLALVAALVLTAACGGKSNTSPGLSDVVTIEIGVVSNEVTPPQSVYKVAKGKDVRLNVYSTTTDVVHVHGYEKTGQVAEGTIVTVEFVADKTGRFDVDMQRSHLKLFQLQVS
jgi:hypothetical protein